MHPFQIEGLRNLVIGLDDFFEEESNMSIHNDHRVETYSSVALESTDIVRVTGQFHGKLMFSNVIVSADGAEGNETIWYGLVSCQCVNVDKRMSLARYLHMQIL